MTRPGPIAAFTASLDDRAKVLAAVAFVPLLVQWAFIGVFLVPRLGTLDYLRLHYTAPRGVDWIGGWPLIFVFPAVGLASWLIDVALAARLAATSRFLARLVLAVAIFVELLLATGGVFAVLLNG